MANSTIYAPLPKASPTIRLLRLLPGTFSADIECELIERPIAEARDSYITISYTWGNASATKQVIITCNGKRVPISENLFTILRRLRFPVGHVTVWADALCINQMDTTERTHQVGLMGEIYRSSYHTVIWLGEPTREDETGERFQYTCCSSTNRSDQALGGPPRLVWKGTAADEDPLNAYLQDCLHDDLSSADVPNDIFGAFCLIQSLAQGTSSHMLQLLREDESKLWARYDYSKGLYDLLSGDVHVRGSRSSRVWAGLERIMSRPWWTRIWVIQETVLSRRATVHFGMLSAPWSMFADAAARFAHDRHSLCLDLSGAFRGHSILTRFSDAVLQIDNTRHHHQDPLSGIDMLSLLWKFRPLEASDKRDKVYALLGLVTNWEGQPPMLPEYQIDVGATFVQTAVNNIQRTQSLTILAGDLDAVLNRKRVENLASWVMDWSLPCLPVEIDRINSLELYNASGGYTAPVRLHEQHSVLEAPGSFIDYIIAVGDVTRHTQISDTCAALRSWNLQIQRHQEIRTRYPTGCTYDEAFWRTVVGDVVHTSASDTKIPYRRARSDDFEAFRAWRMWSRCISRDTLSRTATFSQRDLDEGISSIHYAVKTATTSRRLFVTANGYIGFGPRTTQLGDEVWVLASAKVPFVLSRTHTAAQLPSFGRKQEVRKCGGSAVTMMVGGPMVGGKSVCNKTHGCRRLVGDAFVYGVMDGEGVRGGEKGITQVFLV